MKIFIYVRVEMREFFDDNIRMLRQLSSCIEYSRQNGHKVVKIFYDYSNGAEVGLGLSKLLTACDKGHPDAVLILHRDRISNKLSICDFVITKLKADNITMQTVL